MAKGVEAARRSGNPYAMGAAALAQGRMLGNALRTDEAVAAYDVAIARFAEIGDDRFVLASRSDLAHALATRRPPRRGHGPLPRDDRRLGSPRASRGRREPAREHGLRGYRGVTRPSAAARLLGAAEALRETSGAKMAYDETPELAAYVERLRAADRAGCARVLVGRRPLVDDGRRGGRSDQLTSDPTRSPGRGWPRAATRSPGSTAVPRSDADLPVLDEDARFPGRERPERAEDLELHVAGPAIGLDVALEVGVPLGRRRLESLDDGGAGANVGDPARLVPAADLQVVAGRALDGRCRRRRSSAADRSRSCTATGRCCGSGERGGRPAAGAWGSRTVPPSGSWVIDQGASISASSPWLWISCRTSSAADSGCRRISIDPDELGGRLEAAHQPDAIGRPLHGHAVEVRKGDAVGVLGREPQSMAAEQLVPTVDGLPADVGRLGEQIVRRAGDAETDDPRTGVGEDVEPQGASSRPGGSDGRCRQGPAPPRRPASRASCAGSRACAEWCLACSGGDEAGTSTKASTATVAPAWSGSGMRFPSTGSAVDDEAADMPAPAARSVDRDPVRRAPESPGDRCARSSPAAGRGRRGGRSARVGCRGSTGWRPRSSTRRSRSARSSWPRRGSARRARRSSGRRRTARSDGRPRWPPGPTD